MKVSDAIRALLRQGCPPDLLARWHGGMETQVNVREGERIAGARGCKYIDAGTEYWNIRVPKKANEIPEWNDYHLRWSLSKYAEQIGTTGWDWKKRCSIAVGFDFDSIVGHAKGLSEEQLTLVRASLQSLPYVEIRKSTGGKGNHIWVMVDEIPTPNHRVHAILAKAVLAKMSVDAGHDLSADVDVYGGNMWIWSTRATPENEGLKLIKAATTKLTDADLPGWRDLIAPNREPRIKDTNGGNAGEGPFDLYNADDDSTMTDLLTKWGGRNVSGDEGEGRWWLPGDESHSDHASLFRHDDTDIELLTVYSTGVAPLEAGETYTKARLFAVLEHGGDYSAAARELVRRGYFQAHDPADDFEEATPVAPQKPIASKPTRNPDDIGNGQRFADQHGRDVKYSAKWVKWLYWQGGRWVIDEMGAVERLAKATARKIYGELEAINDSAERGAMVKWAKQSASRGGQSAMLALARSELSIAVDYQAFDAHPYLFNCINGTLDLRTGELREHRREDYLTKRCPLVYPAAYTPPTLWLSFLDRIFAGNANLIGFMQRLMGYALVGEVTEHVLPIFHGGGANGKTVLTETLLGVLGKEYATSTTKEFLMQSKSERHATEIAALYGMRLVVTAETDEGGRLNEARVKQLTGGNTITARRMREDFWQFSPSHLLAMETNHRPFISGTDQGIWRRVLLVPFNVTIPPDEQDKELGNKLKAEWPMILRWMVEGCNLWQCMGLVPPPEVLAASAEYREASDSFSEFLNENCVIAPGQSVRASDLYMRYERWTSARGGQAQSMRRIGERLGAQFKKVRVCSAARYEGIGLRPIDYGHDHDDDSGFEDVTTQPLGDTT